LKKTATPRFDAEFGFLYNSRYPEVHVDIVNFRSSDIMSHWDVVASATIMVDDSTDPENDSVHWESLHIANEPGTCGGNMDIQIMWGCRLLGITIHRLQNLVRFGEERDFHPFVQLAVAGTKLRTLALNSVLDSADIEEDFIFRATDEQPIIMFSLFNQGRVYDEEIGRFGYLFNKSCTEQCFRLMAGHYVVGEVKATVRWINSLMPDPNVTLDPALGTSLSAEDVPGLESASSAPRAMSFDTAIHAYHRQGRREPDQVVTVHVVEVKLTPVVVRVTDADLVVLRGVLDSIKAKSKSQLPPEQSAISRSPELQRRQRYGKRELYTLFKDFDFDKDGRINVISVRDLLREVGHRLPLLRSEVNAQVARLMNVLGFEEDALVTWRSFSNALEKACLQYEHGDDVSDLHCDELVSTTVLRQWFGRNFKDDMCHAIAHLETADDLCAFWDEYEFETRAKRSDLGDEKETLPLQLKLVRLLKNYRAARDVWGILVLPSLYKLPLVYAVSRDTYSLMASPVSIGHRVFIDMPCEIRHMPPALASQMLTGIRTTHRDRTATGQQHLSFTLTKSAVVYVCHDSRLKKVPSWLKHDFSETVMIIETTHTKHNVFRQEFPAGVVSLGGNEGRRRHCSNYFVLIGSDDTDKSLPVGAVPPWLLHDKVFASPSDTLQSYLLSCFGIRSRSSRDRPSASSNTVIARHNHRNDILCLRTSLKCSSVKVHLVNPYSLQEPPRLTLYLAHTDVALDLQHTLSKVWLGRHDRLTGSIDFSITGQYLNSVIDATEFFIEPWSLNGLLANHGDTPITIIRLQAHKHCNINISAPLMQAVKSIIHPPPGQYARRQYRRALRMEGHREVSQRSRMLIVNNLGIALTIECRAGCFFEGMGEGDTPYGEPDEDTILYTEDDEEPFPSVALTLGDGQSAYYCITTDLRKHESKLQIAPPLDVRVHGWKMLTDVKVPWQGRHAYVLMPDTKNDSHAYKSAFQRYGSAKIPHHFGKLKRMTSSPGGFASVNEAKRPDVLVLEAKERDGRAMSGDVVGVLQFRSSVKLVNMSSTAMEACLERQETGLVQKVLLKSNDVLNFPISAVNRETRLQVRRMPEGPTWVESPRLKGSLSRDSLRPPSSSGQTRSMTEASPASSHWRWQSSPASLLPTSPEYVDVEPIILHPVLFDPTIHDALRRTRALEERSLSLEHQMLGTVEDELDTSTGSVDLGSSQQDDGPGGKFSGRARLLMDWTIAALPPYQIFNR